MAAVPIQPRITLNDLAEFVEDASPAGGSMGWEESAQSIVYDVPFAYVYDAVLLLLGYAYVTPEPCVNNASPINPALPGPNDGPPIEITATTHGTPAAPSNMLTAVSSLAGVFRNAPLFFKTSGLEAGRIHWIYSDLTDGEKRIGLKTGLTSAQAGVSFYVGRLPTNNDTTIENRKFLKRLLPAAHPIFPYMTCTRISSWQGIGPRGKRTAASRLPLSTVIQNVQRYTSIYSKLRLTADFTMPKYGLAKDPTGGQSNAADGILRGNEISRFTWREIAPTSDFITLDKGTMEFGEGLVVGTPFTAPGYAQREVMTGFSLYWSHVPEEYVNTILTDTQLGGNTIGLPIRFMQSLQCVNQNVFMGYNPGTLLLDSIEYERYRMPLQFTDAKPQFWARIKSNFKYFNPPYINPPSLADRITFGHMGHQTAPVGPQQYAWFRTANSPNPLFNGLSRYQAYDFRALFYPLTAYEVSATP